MKKSTLIFIGLLFSLSSLCQSNKIDKVKARKLTYADFSKLSINDTSLATIDLFFIKKDNAIYDQMSLLPVTIIIAAIPFTRIIGVGSAAISIPFFINGGFMLIRYRKKKLYNILLEYKETKEMPNWVRRKTNRLLKKYESVKTDY
jgi:hypothetical protein